MGLLLPGALTGLLTLLSVVWFAVNAPARHGPGWLGWVFPLLVIGVNQVQLRRISGSPGMSPEGRRFWRHLVVAQLVIVAAVLVLVWDTVSAPGSVSLATPANILFGLAILVVFWALVRLPARNPIRGRAILRFGLDAAVVVLAVGLFGWYLYFRNYDELVSAVGSQGEVMGLMLFACSAAVAFGKLALAGARGVNQHTMYLLGACVVVASVVGGMLPLIATRPDLNATTVSMTLTFFLFSLTVERERSVLGRIIPERTTRRPFSLAPYLAVAATDGLLLYTRGTYMIVTVTAVALTAIVVGRQILAFYDNARLLRELGASQRQLAHQATHDALTDLANRRLFEERLDAAASTAVILIDLDNFKGVNDRYGHHVGDALLVTVANRLRSSAGPDDLVARLGGDEFAMLLSPASAADPDPLLTRLTAAMTPPAEIDGHELPVGCSIGLAAGAPGADAVELLRRADVAMYAAKSAGKGRHARYAPEMDLQAA